MRSRYAVRLRVGTRMLFAFLICGSWMGGLRLASAQALLESGAVPLEGAGYAVPNSPDSGPFAQGTTAINEGRWADAVTIFAKIAAEHGDHAAGALYWKAYAENKQDQSARALQTCAELRQAYANSSWVDECGALEIEIQTKAGKPVQTKPQDSDDLKLLALNAFMQQNPTLAREQIDAILNSDSSEALKEGALFILGKNGADEDYPQIVRISHLEGDVRVARGLEKKAEWEKAEQGLELETGFILVTGAGRAEIELENASTVYLGDNSILIMNDLHSTNGTPHTEMALLTGSLNTYFDTLMPGESIFIRTPADNVMTRYPAKSFMRINSYVDATGITMLRAGSLSLQGNLPDSFARGQTMYYRDSRQIDGVNKKDKEDFVAWDQWADDLHSARMKADAELMKEAGLTEPIPGLAEMNGQGHFFDCAPYGKCWEPNEVPSAQANMAMNAEPRQANSQQANPQVEVGLGPQSQPVSTGGISRQTLNQFPCVPDEVWSNFVRASGRGYQRDAYDWAVCHAGTWLYQGDRYAWVVGHRRHHHCPIHWVKSGHTIAYVPIHPRDIKGHPPLNREYGFVASRDNKQISLKSMRLDAEHPVSLMKSAPREFRDATPPVLAKAEAPHLEARSFKETNSIQAHTGGIPITFDHKTQSFMMPTQTMHGGHPMSTMAPISNHGGNLQARSGASFSGGSRGGSFGSSSHSSGSGGGSHGTSSGGGSHSGSSSSSSGGSHSGGGSSGSSGSSSSSSSSGGGSHH